MKLRVSAEGSVALAKVDWDAGTEVLIGNTFPVTLVRGWRVALEEGMLPWMPPVRPSVSVRKLP